MSESPLVSAVVLFHDVRSASEALSCIEALQKQTIAEQIEIIPVDNGAKHEAQNIVQSFLPKESKLVEAGANLGFGAGNNLGAAKARGKYILIINPDNRLEPDALEKMVQHIEAHPDIGMIGAQLVFPDGTIRDSFRTFPTLTDLFIKRTPLRFIFKNRMKRYLQWDTDRTQTRDVDWMCGACMLLPRALYQELGGFDERFFLFLEDCDLCRRTWEKELRVVYFPSAKAHDSQLRLSEGGIFTFFTKKTVRIHTASALKYFWKWRGKGLPR